MAPSADHSSYPLGTIISNPRFFPSFQFCVPVPSVNTQIDGVQS